jgi:hypothetical protein
MGEIFKHDKAAITRDKNGVTAGLKDAIPKQR